MSAPKPESLLEDWEFLNDLKTSVAQAVFAELNKTLPRRAVEVGYICEHYHVNHRFDAHRVGQDISMSRINIFTDGKGNAVRMHIG